MFWGYKDYIWHYRKETMGFCLFRNYFFGQHESYNFFLSWLFSLQNLTLGYMTNTLNQIIFFPPPKSEYFFSNIGNQNIFFRKKPIPPPPPPFKLNGRSLSHLSKKNSIAPIIFTHSRNLLNILLLKFIPYNQSSFFSV